MVRRRLVLVQTACRDEFERSFNILATITEASRLRDEH